MIEADRRRVEETFAVRGTEEDRIRDLEERLQRLRLADRFATRSLALELAGRPERRSFQVASPGLRGGARRRASGRWRAVRAIWQRLLK